MKKLMYDEIYNVSKNIYDHLTVEYKASVIRSFLQYKVSNSYYSEEYIAKKILPKGEEDTCEIFGFTEENYKEKIIELMKLKARELGQIEKKYRYFKSIAEFVTVEDIEKCTAIKTDEYGEKYILIGYLKNGEYDNSAYGYCLSPRDEIRGRVLKIHLPKPYKEMEAKEVKTTYVSDTAILRCPKAMGKLKLKVTSHENWYIDELAKATVNDYKGNENIIGEEAICSVTHQKCSPSTSKWEKVTDNDYVGEYLSLTSKSRCKCSVGNCYIEIIDSKSKDYLE